MRAALTTAFASVLLIGCADTVQPAPMDKNIEEIVEEHGNQESVIESDKYEYDENGILICEEDDIGVCIDPVMQDIRASQLRHEHYVTNQPEVDSTEEDGVDVQHEIIDEYGNTYDEYGNPVYYPEEESQEVIAQGPPDLSHLNPLDVRAMSLANEFADNPRKAFTKYGTRRVFISGKVEVVFQDAVLISRILVPLNNTDSLSAKEQLTVFCYGVAPNPSAHINGYPINAVGIDCDY